MNRYESYKDSGIPWLGEVPAHWEVKRLRFTVNLNPVKSELDIPEDTLVSFIPMEAVNFDKNLTLTEERNLDEVYKGYTYFKNGDVVLAKITPCFENGKSAIAQNLTNGVAFGTTELHVLRSQNSINNHFLYYLIKSDSFMKIGESEMYGAGGQKRIPEEFIKNFFIGLPPYYEQTAIAHYLDTKLCEIDALIDKQQTLLEKLAEQRTAVITHAVTKGLNPAAPMKNSSVEWLGDVPAHWQLINLKFLCRVKGGYAFSSDNFSDEGIPVIRISDILFDGTVDNINCKRIPLELAPNQKDFELRNGQLVMAMTGATIGKISKYCSEDYAYINQRVGKFEAFNSRLNYAFLYHLLNTSGYQEHIKLTAFGGAQPNISDSEMVNYQMVLPTMEEQAHIADYLDKETAKIDRLCDTVNQTIDRLKEYRIALITQAVTGKVKVTNE
ncbi:restriction endonuclease subunit S [Eikenella corrodens]|jgi:restriction modification system DNA specificity domain protein|uniref:restriction endonuclease subunit S n=1 Tax=Eikenella corrodens TaxID=539 RepID=UPI0007D06E65|nr:restriction endonuclease subunit S [Eikenella corrodens]OAM30787.1 hypothetical protein A7P93_06320 [Eikenella corrodens]